MSFSAASRSRMVVLGLDGLPLPLAHTLVTEGTCPNLGRILPAARSLRAELPELSPVNWTSFYTGCPPEEHGVFGFTRINSQTYELSLADFSQVTTETIFDSLGRHGLNSKIINLPNTYPARGFTGGQSMLVSGFVAYDLARAVFPPFLLGPLTGAGYRLEADTVRGSTDPDFLLRDLRATLASRSAALDLFWPDLAWDLFVLVLTETDRLFHFLYPALTHQSHPLHDAVRAFMRDWDTTVGQILDRYEALPGPKRLMVLADHGFTELITEVDINTWLVQHGYLQLGPPNPAAPTPELDGTRILPSSRAFALDPGRIYLHTQSRFGRGSLPAEQTASLAREIRDQLLTLTWQGQPVIREVHMAHDLYPGSKLALAPDLICEPHPGFDLKAKFDRTEVFGLFDRHGTHTVDNAFFYDSADNGTATRLHHTGRLILEHFSLADSRTDQTTILL